MLTAKQTKTGAENIARISRAAEKEAPHRIIGIVNFAGYQIIDASTGKTLKTSGNNPTTSNPKQNLPKGEGLSVGTLKQWCEMDAKRTVEKMGASWRGVREGEFE